MDAPRSSAALLPGLDRPRAAPEAPVRTLLPAALPGALPAVLPTVLPALPVLPSLPVALPGGRPLPAALTTVPAVLAPVVDPPFWVWLLLVVAPLAVLVTGLVSLARVVPRLRRARDGEGVVVEVGDQGVDGGQRMWRLTIDYTDADGEPRRGVWHGDSRLDRSLYAPGMAVPVRYDPRRPGWVHVPGGSRPHPLVVPVGLLVVGVVSLLPVALAAGVLGSV